MCKTDADGSSVLSSAFLFQPAGLPAICGWNEPDFKKRIVSNQRGHQLPHWEDVKF